MGLRDTTRSPRYNRADRSGKLLLSCGMLGRPPGMWASVFATVSLSFSLSPPARFIFVFQPSFIYHRDSSFSLHRSSRPFPFLSPFPPSPPRLLASCSLYSATPDLTPPVNQPTPSFQSVIHSTPLPYPLHTSRILAGPTFLVGLVHTHAHVLLSSKIGLSISYRWHRR